MVRAVVHSSFGKALIWFKQDRDGKQHVNVADWGALK